MSTIVDNATDALHSVSGRLTLPDDLSDSVGALGDRLGGISDAIVPTKTIAVGTGTRAAVAGGRTFRRHPVLVIGGSIAVVAAIVWLITRRSGDDANATPRGVERVGDRNAA